MKTIWPIALISFKEGLRHRVLFGVVIFAFLFNAFAVLISGFFMRDILKITLDLCLSMVSIGGLLVPFFLTITLLSGDIEQRTIYTILARPVSRANYIVGKFIGLGLVAASIISILTVTTLLAVWGSTQIYPDHFFTGLSVSSILVSSFMALLGILTLNSTVVLWCCITTSSFLATLLTLSTYVVGQTVEDLVHFVSVQTPGVEISPVVKKVIHVTLYVFPNLAAFDFKQQAAHGLAISLQEVFFVTIYGCTYTTAILIIAVLYFKKRDLP
ncbi:MAG: ABC transporter permease subunit [Desulfobulbaceae bacterium]|nr:ABC transporter permease subunit [Desulfobulbaceae bacterium]